MLQSVTYCPRCKLGTIDEAGLCSLCGEPQSPPTRRARLVEIGGALLASLVGPGALLFVLVAAVLSAAAFIGGRASPPVLLPGLVFGLPGQAETLDRLASDPLAAAQHLLLGAFLQSVVLFVVLLAALALWRVLRSRADRESDERGRGRAMA
jgi:hypothetical protein